MMVSEEIMQLNSFLEAKEKQIILLNYLNPEHVYPGQHPCKMSISGRLGVENVGSKSRDRN